MRLMARVSSAMMFRISYRSLMAALLVALSASAFARSTGQPRAQSINLVVIHSTGGPTCDAKTGRLKWVKSGSLAANMRFIEAHPQLGIHYMIDRDGTLQRSVPEDQIAHHVFGHSARSIAIELINDGDGVDPFSQAQLSALTTLIQDIATRRGVTRQGVKRHSDLDLGVMPCDRSKRRKVDPGAAFPFEAVLDAAFALPAR
jgi:N-acetylmuramoyl-L-alanine amidase